MQATVFHASRHLGGDEIVAATDRCPVCLASGDRPAVLRVQDDPAVDLLHCPRCRAASASHMPRPQVLERYYQSYYAGKDEKLTFANADRFARHIARYVRRIPEHGPLRILDFGGGDGTLARKIADRMPVDRAIEVDLVDYASPGDLSTDRIQLRGHRDLDTVTGLYDLIVASAILEHIPQVHAVIRRLFDLARPGGYFYARTPYILPLARLVKSIDITYPAHVHDMGCSFWNRVIHTFDLRATVVRSAPSPVESSLAADFARTIVAASLKLPGRVENLLSPRGRRDRYWNFVGGWEIMLHFEPRP